MASSPSLAAPFVARRRLAPAAVAALALLLGVLFLIVMGALGAIFGLRPLSSGGYRPSQLARADIPAQYLQLYVAAGRRYGIDPWILAGIGSVETDHGRSPAPGVHSGVNAFGCCAGPMQFSVVGSPSTWDRYGVDGNDDGRTSVYDPADAIPAAARYLRASGAPDDYHAALFAYNHADWYVAAGPRQGRRVPRRPTASRRHARARLAAYCATCCATRGSRSRRSSDQTCAPARSTRASSPRSAWIGRHHSVVITALKSDHSRYTVDGAVSNHAAGRAMDIGAVDGEICRGTRTGSVRRPRARARRGSWSAALDRAHLLLGPRRACRPARLRPRRSLRPHPLGSRSMTRGWPGVEDVPTPRSSVIPRRRLAGSGSWRLLDRGAGPAVGASRCRAWVALGMLVDGQAGGSSLARPAEPEHNQLISAAASVTVRCSPSGPSAASREAVPLDRRGPAKLAVAAVTNRGLPGQGRDWWLSPRMIEADRGVVEWITVLVRFELVDAGGEHAEVVGEHAVVGKLADACVQGGDGLARGGVFELG